MGFSEGEIWRQIISKEYNVPIRPFISTVFIYLIFKQNDLLMCILCGWLFCPSSPTMTVHHLSAEPAEVVAGMWSPGDGGTDGCKLPHALGMVPCSSERAASTLNYFIIS